MWTHVLAQAAQSASDPWAGSIFSGLDPNMRFAALLTALGCATGIIITFGTFLYCALDAAHRRRTEANLKRDMLDRGMSVDEVVKVIEAAAPPEDVTSRWVDSWCKRRK